jgi:uncharacterized protein YqcC (DUF446 family)
MSGMAESDDLRTFIQEITLRFERAIERISEDLRGAIAVQREESRRYFEEMLDENREQRQALLAILDRLDNGGTAPAG